ncbi:organic cation transporter protein-like [Actinia tenebrosa]|uniref:Organic cation transporter protein-like n=1 Tax=Actinia tenebrosa TaxID=6105 RepID=A0A6P8HZT9_ACTTE|nr:organic cation transporter protein-like [Actinia tenebrosa]
MVAKQSKPKADLEDLWQLVGGFGRYPILLTIFMMYVTIVVSFHTFIQTFYGTAPNYECVSNEPNNTSSCPVNKCGCQNCTYVFAEEFTSAVSEWNLICTRGHLKAMTQAVFMAGLLIGSVGFGKFSDHFGRKPTTFVSLILMALFGFGSTFANSLTLFAVMRFGSGLSTSGSMLVKFVYCMEISRLPQRTSMGIICNLFVAIGAMLLTLLAYCLPEWRDLMLAVTLSGIPGILLWRWFPESPRWLIAKGKLKEAQTVFESFASTNSVQVDSNQIASTIQDIKNAESHTFIKTDKKSMTGILDLVRTPKMRKRSLVLAYNWFVNSVIFYGITLNAKNLGGSLYLNAFILFGVGIPSILLLWYVLKRLGRRICYCLFMLLGGIACAMVIAVPGTSGDHPAVKALAIIGNFCIIATFSGVYIYNLELSPTLLRNLSLGVGSMLSRVGGIVAPYVVFLNDIMQNLPLVIFGVMAFIAGTTALLLPETLFSSMPQTVQQVESWDEDYSVPWRRRRHRDQVSKNVTKEGEADDLINGNILDNSMDLYFRETTV